MEIFQFIYLFVVAYFMIGQLGGWLSCYRRGWGSMNLYFLFSSFIGLLYLCIFSKWIAFFVAACVKVNYFDGGAIGNQWITVSFFFYSFFFFFSFFLSFSLFWDSREGKECVARHSLLIAQEDIFSWRYVDCQ